MGGVCAIRCTAAGRTLLYAAPDIRGQQNRFLFSQSTGTCVHAALAADWRTHGSGAFTFQVLEELKRRPDQTPAEFQADLKELVDLWREKLAAEGCLLYP